MKFQNLSVKRLFGWVAIGLVLSMSGMLFMEGFYYWGVSLSLAVTIGTAIFILLYMIFSKVAYYAVFSYPFIPLVLVSGLVLLICLIVPIWVYKTDVNLPVVERLRLTE